MCLVSGPGLNSERPRGTYEKIHSNLLLHNPDFWDFPTADALRSKVALGNENWDIANSVPSADTDGSELIVSVLIDSNPQPVWLLAWGGTNTMAQAL